MPSRDEAIRGGELETSSALLLLLAQGKSKGVVQRSDCGR